MKTVSSLKSFLASSSIAPALVRAVVKQVGGWETFREIAPDITNHGADCGFSGFTYYTDTVPFNRKNRKSIQKLTENMASDMGGTSIDLVKNFRCIKLSTIAEIARTLYGTGDGDTDVANALAWFALESVARSFVDMTEED